MCHHCYARLEGCYFLEVKLLLLRAVAIYTHFAVRCFVNVLLVMYPLTVTTGLDSKNWVGDGCCLLYANFADVSHLRSCETPYPTHAIKYVYCRSEANDDAVEYICRHIMYVICVCMQHVHFVQVVCFCMSRPMIYCVGFYLSFHT